MSNKFLLLSTCLMLFSCKTETPTIPGGSPGRLLPLAVGNTWEYVDTTFYSPDSFEVYHRTYSVVGTKKILSGTDSVEVFIYRFHEAQSDYFLGYESEGLVHYTYKESGTPVNTDLKSLWLKDPVLAGEQWKVDHGDYFDQMYCVSTDTTVITPLGTFRSVLLRMGSNSLQYYKANLGKVYDSYNSPSHSSREYLVSYQVH